MEEGDLFYVIELKFLKKMVKAVDESDEHLTTLQLFVSPKELILFRDSLTNFIVELGLDK